MEKDEIQFTLQRWLSRKTPMSSIREVIDLPIALASDVGVVRTENQDRLVLLRTQVTSEKSFLVGVLCDGMGGMVDGKGCAELAVSAFISSCIRHRSMDSKKLLLNAVNYSNNVVFKKYEGNGGATLSAFILNSDKQLEAINVGDSRIYIEKDNIFEQVTTDDTISGQLSNRFHDSELSHRILQYIGIGPSLEPHSIEFPCIDKISKILITSDGSHYIAHDTLRRIISPPLPSVEIVERLINVAKWCGGHDNASALLLTDLPSFFLKDEDIHIGAVDIWDPFGDVQFIAVEAPLSQKAITTSKLLLKEDTATSVTDQLEPSSEDEDKSESELKLDNKVERKKRNQKDKTKAAPEKLNLRIDFDK